MKEIPTVVVISGGVLLTIGLAIQYRRYCNRERFRKTKAPHPKWKPDEKQISPFKDAGFQSLDPSGLPASEFYPLVISGVVPRPIAFVSSLNAEGVGNLAPFSYFTAVSHNPPCVVVSVCRSPIRKGAEKDTAANISKTKEFVVNIISEWFIESANYCCSPFIPEVNEMEIVGLTPIPSVKVKPPRVEESAFQMECKLKHSYDIINSQRDVGTTVFIGEVVMFHINKGVLGKTPSGKPAVELENYKPMCRLGGQSYGRISSIFDLPRPERTT